MSSEIEHSRPGEFANAALKEVVRDPVVDEILDRIRRQPDRDPAHIEKALREIGKRCSQLPVLDNRTSDEILGYGEDGLPH
jgi:antitoxin VapB